MASGPPRGRRLPLHEHHDVESAAVYGFLPRGRRGRRSLIHLLLWIFATPAVVLLGGPFLRETWSNALQGRLTSSTLITVGVAAAYLYSAVAVLERSAQVYFDTASMVLMLFTLGRYLEAASRARAARDLQPLLAAESEWATVVEGETQSRLPVRDVQTGTLVRILPGERIPVDGIVVEGASLVDAVITGRAGRFRKVLAPRCSPAASMSTARSWSEAAARETRPAGRKSAGRSGTRRAGAPASGSPSTWSVCWCLSFWRSE